MGKQSNEFDHGGEGDAWYERNELKLPPHQDPVQDLLEASGIIPSTVLEVGCADGWRLAALATKYGCEISGAEPSDIAVSDSTIGDIQPVTADRLSRWWPEATFDLVIYGFCLYLCDREDLFKIVMEGDRVLQDGGYLVIHDFDVPSPYSKVYKHKPSLRSFKMDHSLLWLANPAYSVYRRQVYGDSEDELTSVVILKKNLADAWPLHD